MNDQVIDKIYEQTINDKTYLLPRVEQIRRYIELYLELTKDDEPGREKADV